MWKRGGYAGSVLSLGGKMPTNTAGRMPPLQIVGGFNPLGEPQCLAISCYFVSLVCFVVSPVFPRL